MNYKTFLLLGIIVLIVLGSLVAAYLENGRQSSTSSPEKPLANLQADKKIEEEKPYYRVEATLPSSTTLSGTAGENALTLMDGFVRATIESFLEQSGVRTLTEEDIALLGLGGERKYTLQISYEAHESPSTISYVFTLYEDTLGAHPNASYKTFTWDKETGQELLIGNLFEGDEYLAFLSEESRAQIRTRLGEDVNEEYLESGTTPDAPNFQYFYLEGDELVIIFPPYQVGPWAIGTQKTSFPLGNLVNVKIKYQ